MANVSVRRASGMVLPAGPPPPETDSILTDEEEASDENGSLQSQSSNDAIATASGITTTEDNQGFVLVQSRGRVSSQATTLAPTSPSISSPVSGAESILPLTRKKRSDSSDEKSSQKRDANPQRTSGGCFRRCIARRKSNEHNVVPKLDSYRPGYLMFSAFMDSQPGFMACRKFSQMRAYLILNVQDEIVQMENELRKLDDEEQAGEWLKSRRWDAEDNPDKRRRKLIERLHLKIPEYDKLVLSQEKFQSLPLASSRNMRSIWNMIENTKCFSKDEAKTFKDRADDFAALADDHDRSGADGVLEEIVDWIPKLNEIFKSKKERNLTHNPLITLYSPTRVSLAIRLFIVVIAIASLIGPMFALYFVDTIMKRICIILAFMSGFSVSLALFTTAKRHEIFAATAAYCAVLVVFLEGVSYTNQPAQLIATGPKLLELVR